MNDVSEKTGRTITINCGTTCQKVGTAMAGIGTALIGIPLVLVILCLFSKMIYHVLFFMIGTDCSGNSYCRNDGVDILTVLGTAAFFDICAGIVAYTIATWNNKR